MGKVQGQIELTGHTWAQVDKELGAVGDVLLHGPAVGVAMRAVGREINKDVKSQLPKPGYPGDKPGLTPLRETLRVRTKNYQRGAFKVAIIGYTRPDGSHGHLLEGGHDMVVGGKKGEGGVVVGYVQAQEYMIRIVRETKSRQNRTMITALKRELAKKKYR